MEQAITWHMVYFIVAAHFYIYDKKPATRLRRLYVWLFNLTHSEQRQLNADVEQGFIYQQKIRVKIEVATFFSVILTGIFLLISSEMSIATEVILFFTKTAVVFIGFLFGVLLDKGYTLLRRGLKTVDDIESGKIDVQGAVNEAIDSASDKLKETYEVVTDSLSQPTKPNDAPSQPVEPENDSALQNDDYYINKLKNYQDK